jgi:hypothetical protein
MPACLSKSKVHNDPQIQCFSEDDPHSPIILDTFQYFRSIRDSAKASLDVPNSAVQRPDRSMPMPLEALGMFWPPAIRRITRGVLLWAEQLLSSHSFVESRVWFLMAAVISRVNSIWHAMASDMKSKSSDPWSKNSTIRTFTACCRSGDCYTVFW